MSISRPFVRTLVPFAFPCLFAAGAAGCAKMLTIPSEVPPAQAATIIQSNRSNPDFVLLDVRTPKEYAETHLPGALNIDFSAASFRPEIAGLDRSKIYLIYCRSGNRSGRALGIMKDMGFVRAAYIKGGINGCIAAGMRTVPGPEPGDR